MEYSTQRLPSYISLKANGREEMLYPSANTIDELKTVLELSDDEIVRQYSVKDANNNVRRICPTQKMADDLCQILSIQDGQLPRAA